MPKPRGGSAIPLGAWEALAAGTRDQRNRHSGGPREVAVQGYDRMPVLRIEACREAVQR